MFNFILLLFCSTFFFNAYWSFALLSFWLSHPIICQYMQGVLVVSLLIFRRSLYIQYSYIQSNNFSKVNVHAGYLFPISVCPLLSFLVFLWNFSFSSNFYIGKSVHLFLCDFPFATWLSKCLSNDHSCNLEAKVLPRMIEVEFEPRYLWSPKTLFFSLYHITLKMSRHV